MSFLPYFIVFLYPILGYLFEKCDFDENEIYCKLQLDKIFHSHYVWIVFMIFSAIRGNGDGDYFKYLNGVKYIDSFSKVFYIEEYPFEIGFRFIAYIVNLIKFPPQVVLFILSYLSLYNINYAIKRYSSNAWVSWILYFPFLLLFDMHHTRNAVAMAFTLRLFTSLILEKDYRRSVLFSFFAFSFHKSSIFAILVIVAYAFVVEKFIEKPMSKKTYYVLIIVALFIRLVFGPKKIVNLLYSLMPNTTIIYKLYAYLSNERWSYAFSLLDPRFILLLFVFIFGAKFVTVKSEKYIHYLNMTFIAVLVVILFSESTILTIRIYNFFNLYTILLVPYLIRYNILEEKKKEIFSVLLISSYIVYALALIMKQVPYYLYF